MLAASSKATSLKNFGNNIFAKSKYEEAGQFYERALQIIESEKGCKSSINDNNNNNNKDVGKNSSDSNKNDNATPPTPTTPTNISTNAADDVSSSSLYLKAVCLSNLSNCLFEQGFYAKSLEQAKSCLETLDEISQQLGKDDSACNNNTKTKALWYKNMLRMARASFYNQDFEDCRTILEQLIANNNNNNNNSDDSDAYIKRAKRMQSQVACYTSTDNAHPTNPSLLTKPVRLLRAGLLEPIVEYYRFGHDTITSALDANQTRDGSTHKGLDLKTFPELSILMAGINDGRHVLATIMHTWKQYQNLNHNDTKKKQQVKLELVCNDISSASMARFVLVMVILDKIGTLTNKSSTRRDLKKANSSNHQKEAAKWCTVLQYVFLSYAMPPWVHDMLIQVMEEIRSYSKDDDGNDSVPNGRNAFEKNYPWLPCTSDRDWEQIQPVLTYWICQAKKAKNDNDKETTGNKKQPDNSNEQEPPNPSIWADIPSTKDCLDHHYVDNSDNVENVFNRANVSGSMKSVLDQRRAHAAARKAQHIKEMKDIRNWDLDLMRSMTAKLGPNATQRDLVESYIGQARGFPLEEFDPRIAEWKDQLGVPGIPLAVEFLNLTKAILPPKGQCDNPIFERIYKQYGKRSWPVNINQKDIRKARHIIDTTWAPNPTMFDPLYYSIDGSCSHEFSPIRDFMSDFDSLDYSYDPIDGSLIHEPGQKEVTEFCDWTYCFFWNAAHALVQLCNEVKGRVLTLQWNVGDIVSICQSIREATPKRRFHSIKASNIPDYTGMLSFATEVIPLLHESTKQHTFRLHVNLLLNCQFWNSYAQFVYSTTAIQGLEKVEDILGMKHLGDSNIDSWGEYFWVMSKNSNTRKATKEEFTLWLQRLFLLVTLPPERNHNNSVRENCPNNMAIFARVCVFCVQGLGYPVHWVSSALDDLAVPGPLKTRALISNRSPSAFQKEGVINQYNVSAFMLDFRTQLALALQKQNNGDKAKHLLPLEFSMLLTTSVNQYEMTIPLDLTNGTGRIIGKQYGVPASQCLALVLEPNEPTLGKDAMLSEFEETCEDPSFLAMLRRMKNVNMSRESIRDDIVSQGAEGFQVLSCLDWQALRFGSSNRIRFCLPQEDFTKYQQHYVSILRTDGWFRVGQAVPLSTAKPVPHD